MVAIRGRHVVFRVSPIYLGRIIEVLVGTEALVNDDRFSEFFFGDVVDSLSPSFVLQSRSTGHEPLSLGGLVFAFSQENIAIMFDDEVNGDARNVLHDCPPLGGRDWFFLRRQWQSK